MIDLYTSPTPNGWKASITLEELEIPYQTTFVNLMEGEQRDPTACDHRQGEAHSLHPRRQLRIAALIGLIAAYKRVVVVERLAEHEVRAVRWRAACANARPTRRTPRGSRRECSRVRWRQGPRR